MRKSVFFGCLLVFTSLVPVAVLHAQFQEPTRDELQMTADPKAPGAAAVYLYREETTDDALHFHSYYERIKVLTEKGKEQATIRIPYERGQFKVTDIRGRTIHADGSIVPLTAQPSDLVDVKTRNFQVNTMVFTLPSVEVGSILEYRLQLRYGDELVSEPTWQVQQPFFVHKAHYMFNPANQNGSRSILDSRGQLLSQLMYSVIGIPLKSVVQSLNGRYTVDLTDIPPTPDEEWMPPLNTINQRVEFYYTYARTGGDFWQSEGKRWAKETDRFANPGDQMKKAVEEIVAPADTEEQKARKIYAAVMKLDNTDFSRRKSEAERKAEKLKAIKDARDVWTQQSGSGDEIALLYVALARAAALKVWPMQVVNRNRAILDPHYLSVSQLDDYIAIVELNGKEVFVDPGQKMCPFGLLHWKHTMAGGIRLSAAGPTFAATPAGRYIENTVQRVGSLDLSEDGSVKGTLRFVLAGQDALHWRQLALRNDPDEVKKQFNETMRQYIPDGVQADFDHFLALDDYNVNLMGIVKVTGNMGTATGKRFFLPGLFFESRASHPFVTQNKRDMPIDVHYPKEEIDKIDYHLPPGFALESAPQSTSVPWPNTALLAIGSKSEGDTVTVVRKFLYNFTLLDPKDYSQVHDFYQKVATADQQQLVLTRAQTAGGN